MKIKVAVSLKPELDHNFMPAILWNREFIRQAKATLQHREIAIMLYDTQHIISSFSTTIFPNEQKYYKLNLFYIERLIKFLLWSKGGCGVTITNCPELLAPLREMYAINGTRQFDSDLIGNKIYQTTLHFSDSTPQGLSKSVVSSSIGGNFDGCRVGFDLGGSDRKCAAVMDGEVIYSEEIKWDPYFQSDPNYHYHGIRDSIERAAAKLPKLDAIGGSAAGIYLNNHPKVASLFRGVNQHDYKQSILPLFTNLQAEYNVPLVVVNDGDVTALAGAITMQQNDGVLGISMGTSLATGYVDPTGSITGWLNELAFAPLDFQAHAPTDEWSGDHGCGVQYFSQQAVARLAKTAGIRFSSTMPLAERLVKVQGLLNDGDDRAAAIFRTIGQYLGYAIATYCEHYNLQMILILGRVTSGIAADIMIKEAKKVLSLIAPRLTEEINLTTPNEQFKRHGQAVIAASLPIIGSI